MTSRTVVRHLAVGVVVLALGLAVPGPAVAAADLSACRADGGVSLLTPAPGEVAAGSAYRTTFTTDGCQQPRVTFDDRFGAAATLDRRDEATGLYVWSLTWDTTAVQNGAHVLLVTSDGPVAHPLVLQVGNPYPTVGISSPSADGGAPGEGELVTATVVAPTAPGVQVRDVAFYLDGTPLGSDASAPYGVPLSTARLGNGRHALTAVMTDTVGGRAVSAVRSLAVMSPTTMFSTYPTAPLAPGAVATVEATVRQWQPVNGAGAPGMPVTLSSRPTGSQGRFREVARATTDLAGRAVFTFRPAVSAEYQLDSDMTATHFGSRGSARSVLVQADPDLGRATSVEYAVPGGTARDHERGRVYRDERTGASAAVVGEILAAYLGGQGPWGRLGLPTSGELLVTGGRVTHFQHGDIYWSPVTGAHTVLGEVLRRYLWVGSTSSLLGLPTGEEQDVPGGRRSAFVGGNVYWSATTGAHVVSGPNLATYLSAGGAGGRLGLPTADTCGYRGHARLTGPGLESGAGEVTTFEHGEVHYLNSTRTSTVTYGP